LNGEYNGKEISDITRLFLDNMTRVTEAEDTSKFLKNNERVYWLVQSVERININIS
jgi:hypothetical protein